MRIVFEPAEGERREYDFDESRTLMSTEAAVVEKLTGWDFRGEFLQRLPGSVQAQRALLFVLEKRTHPTLAFKDFDFPAGAVSVLPDLGDMQRARALVESGQVALSPEQRAEALAQLDEAEAALGETAPKSPPTGTSDGEPAT